jgi:hypothetical protein
MDWDTFWAIFKQTNLVTLLTVDCLLEHIENWAKSPVL